MTNAPPRRPLRILRIIARLNVGGPARHVVLLNRALDERGYHTLLVHGAVDAGEASLEHLAAESAVRTIKLPELGRRISPFDDVRAFVKLLTLTFREQPDIVHTHTAKAGTLGRIAAFIYNRTRRRSRRCAVVHTFHGHVLDGYFGPAMNQLVRVTERVLAATSDRIVTISPTQQRDIVERFHVAPRSKTVVVPLGLELRRLFDNSETTPTLRRNLGVSSEDLVFGFVGRMVPIKNLELLIDAFARARTGLPALRLILAGDGPLRAQLEHIVAVRQLAAAVFFLGWREDLAALYATIDACVISSSNEGTPVAVIEAMAAGKPVIATAVGGVPDIVDDGVTGLLVPSGDVERFADALVQMAADAERRRRLGAAARESAKRFGIDRLANDIEAVYVEALRNRRGTAAATA